MPGIDFNEAKMMVSIRDVLTYMDWKPLVNTHQVARGKCPFHHSTNPQSRSFAVNYLENGWFCHKCKTGGDQLYLISLYLKLPVFEATRQICKVLHGRVPYMETRGTGRGTVKGRQHGPT